MLRRRDLFCRVIDNHGDAGVCWRLAVALAAEGAQVRLVIDDPQPLAWMAPGGAPGVHVERWPGTPAAEPGEVVVEAFGCDPPAPFVERMAAAARAPVWINLEYLSAEDWVERAHALPSPQRNGLTKWFYFPGFTARTGGLLRERDLLAQHQAFDRRAWLQAQGLAPAPGEQVALLFCYDNPALEPALHDLAQHAPTLLLATPGPAARQLAALAAQGALPPRLRVHALPYVPQAAFDRLLWASDFNAVRGEDSLVRAIWAGAPFVWQAYPQHDGAHGPKVEAMAASAGFAPEVRALWRAWNGLQAPDAPWPGVPPRAAWEPALSRWRTELASREPLAPALLAFAEAKASGKALG